MNRVFLIVACIILMLPLWLMAVGSFQDMHGMMRMPPKLLPTNPTLSNYQWVLKQPLFTWIGNTIIVTVGITLLSTVSSLTAGYAFSFFHFPGKKILWTILLSGIMVPRISLLIPLFVITRKLHLSGSLLSVILPCIYMPVNLYLARTYFDSIPRSLLDAARIDGANEWQVLTKVVAPVSKPIVTALVLFSSIAALQDYILQTLMLQKTNAQTLLVGLLKSVMDRGGGDLNVNPLSRSMAVGCVLALPLIAVFLAANRYFVEGIQGSVKE